MTVELRPMTVVTDASRLDLRAYLRPGDHIVWGQACGEPATLVEALIAQAATIGDLSAFSATSFSGCSGRKPERSSGSPAWAPSASWAPLLRRGS